MDDVRERLKNAALPYMVALLWLWVIFIIIADATNSAKQSSTLPGGILEFVIVNTAITAAPLVMVGISLLRTSVSTGRLLVTLIGGILGILTSFSYLYWQIGTTANFNIRLTHFDSWYIALGMFTASGTGNIVATSERAREIQTLQMIFDMAIVVFLAGILVSRISEGLHSRRKTEVTAHHTETANSSSPEEKT